MKKYVIIALCALLAPAAFAQANNTDLQSKLQDGAEQARLAYEEESEQADIQAIEFASRLKASVAGFVTDKKTGKQSYEYYFCNALPLNHTGKLLLGKECVRGIKDTRGAFSFSMTLPNKKYYRVESGKEKIFRTNGDYAVFQLLNQRKEASSQAALRGYAARYEWTIIQKIFKNVPVPAILGNHILVNDDFERLFNRTPDETLAQFLQKNLTKQEYAKLF